MLTVQVSVRDKNAGVVIVELLNDRGNGIVQFGSDQMAALTRQDFQLAILVEAGQHRVFHAEALDGLVQLLEVVTVPVNGESVNVRLFQIGRVEDRGEGFALAGDRQRFLILFRGWAQLFAQQFCDRRTGRPDSSGADGLFLFLCRGLRRRSFFRFFRGGRGSSFCRFFLFLIVGFRSLVRLGRLSGFLFLRLCSGRSCSLRFLLSGLFIRGFRLSRWCYFRFLLLRLGCFGGLLVIGFLC